MRRIGKPIIFIIPIVLLNMLRFDGVCKDFENLGFEMTALSVDGDCSSVTVSAAFPSWTVRLGDEVQTRVLFNCFLPGPPAEVSLRSRQPGVLAGQFQAYLKSGVGSSTNGNDKTVSASISQTGIVPLRTLSVSFLALVNRSVERRGITIHLSGEEIPLFEFGDRLAGDVRSFSGRMVELAISADINSSSGGFVIDDIRFSSEPLPPPELAIERMEASAVKLKWDRGALQHSSDLVSWQDMPEAESPYMPDRASRGGYFRLRY